MFTTFVLYKIKISESFFQRTSDWNNKILAIRHSYGQKPFFFQSDNVWRLTIIKTHETYCWSLSIWFLNLRTRHLKPGNYFNPLSPIVITTGACSYGMTTWTPTWQICISWNTDLFVNFGCWEKNKHGSLKVSLWHIYLSLWHHHIFIVVYIYMSFVIQRVIYKLFRLRYQHFTSPWNCTWNSSECWKQNVLSWTWIFLPNQPKEITQVII